MYFKERLGPSIKFVLEAEDLCMGRESVVARKDIHVLQAHECLDTRLSGLETVIQVLQVQQTLPVVEIRVLVCPLRHHLQICLD